MCVNVIRNYLFTTRDKLNLYLINNCLTLYPYLNEINIIKHYSKYFFKHKPKKMAHQFEQRGQVHYNTYFIEN